jgi:XRE family transcriptional regulator, aerobic/anaerobic benzoate catabolism transcriptional regulator
MQYIACLVFGREIYFRSVHELEPLGESVRRARLARALTLKDLAERAGLSERFLSDLERGKGNISIARLWAVARALDTKLSELVAPLDQVPTLSKVALIGLRGAGKSTIGKKAAAKLGVPFVELDERIEQAAGMPLVQIFEIYGDGYFRKLEREVLSTIIRDIDGSAIIATGGGIVMDPESWRLLKRSTRTLWLKAKPEEHLKRVIAQGDTRPMQNRPSAMSELRALLAARAPLYREADETIDTSSLGVAGAVSRVIDVAREVGA